LDGKIVIRDVESEMKAYYIDYAMSVITGRALPDVRDGLKPVHRRIIYAMYELGVTPEKGYRKCARIVGDVLGKYHPHGDTAVYDALVRMAQTFSLRYTLVDGHGNFGSVDGDSASAMRYTESRQTKIFSELVRDISKGTVDFTPNFDGEEDEPTVLPSRFPNLLVNGSDGIAVGMKTSIPSHNMGEVIDAVVEMIDNPDCTIDNLMKHIVAPDFATGATIINKDIKSIYETGMGKVTIRSKYHIEIENHKNLIVIEEIPYQINKAKLIEFIDYVSKKHKEKDKVTKKEKEIDAKIPEIADVRDESDREGMRIVIELKKDSDTNSVLYRLFKHTKLQNNFSVNMLALVHGEPKVLNLKQMLFYYLEHQKDIITRKTKYILKEAQSRLHILEGLKVALENVKKVVGVIIDCKTTNEAEMKLMETFSFSQKQAKYILDLKLQRLVSLEIEKVNSEYDELIKNVDYYNMILDNESVLLGEIKKDILEVKEKYNDDRRSVLIEDIFEEHEEIIEENVENYNVMFYLTNDGYFKKIPLTSLRNTGEQKLKDNDFIVKEMQGENIDDVLVFTNKGNVYRIKAHALEKDKIPEFASNYLPRDLGFSRNEKIVGIINTHYENKDDSILIIYKNGNFARITTSSYKSANRMLKGNQKNEIMYVRPYVEEELLCVTTEGKCVVIDTIGISPVASRTVLGVKGVKIPEDHKLVDVISNPVNNYVIVLKTQKKEVSVKLKKSYYKGNRNNAGVFIYNTKQNKDKILSFIIKPSSSNP
jgi:DNA gyrase subunit A